MIILILTESAANRIFISGEGMSHRQNKREPKMNSTNNQNNHGTASLLAQHVQNELRKTETESWLGFPPPEELERLRAQTLERQFQVQKSRAEAKDRRREELKQAAKRKMKGGMSDE